MNRKFSAICVATGVAIATALFSTQLIAQNDDTGGLVTVLDVASVFDSNPEFQQRMDAIKAEADGLKNDIQAQQNSIREKAMELQNFEVGTPERNQLEGTLEQQQTELRTKARQSEQELLNREAVIYYETYSLMQKVVEQIATENGISLVLRYDSSEIDPTNRPEVIKGVNRTVVFHRNLDLTKLVISRINQRSAAAPATSSVR